MKIGRLTDTCVYGTMGRLGNIRIVCNIDNLAASQPNRPGRDISDSQRKLAQVTI